MKDNVFRLNRAILTNNLDEAKMIISTMLNFKYIKVSFDMIKGETVLNIKGDFCQSDILDIKSLISLCDTPVEINDCYAFNYNELMASIYH